MSRSRNALQIATLGLFLLAAWRLVLGWTGLRADFGDSSYQANLIRLETHLERPRPPEVVLAGSSVTGRLLPRYFADSGTPDVGNLGLDGSTALLGLEILATAESVPRVVFVETYLFGREPGPNDAALLAALERGGARLARWDPVFQSATRPSALLYSWMKTRTEGRAGMPAPPPATADTDAAQTGVEAMAGDRPALPVRWRDALAVLVDRGVRVVLLDLPLGRAQASPTADRAASELGLERLDLGASLRASGVEPRYTDGLHLDAPTARAACALLARWLQSAPRADAGGAGLSAWPPMRPVAINARP